MAFSLPSTFSTCRLLLYLFIVTTSLVSYPNSSAAARRVTLEWDANNEPDLIGYRVFCGESSGAYTISHDITGSDPDHPPPTTFEFTGLEEGKTYYFAAVAFNENGQSDYSQEISHTIPVNPNDSDDDGDGFSENQGDCNDTDAAINPGAADTCGDRIDQDCNGSDLTCVDLNEDSDNDVLPDYDKVSINQAEPNRAYKDGDGLSDGEEVAGGIDPFDQNLKPNELQPTLLPMEFGEIEVNDRWKTVTLNRLYDEPVVIVGALSHNGPDPSVIRVRNVTGSGFEVRVQEWEYLDGHHAIEQVNYLVIESGSYELPGGSRVEAGRFSANAVGSFAAVPFKQPFSTVPVVMTTTTSANEGDAVAMRLRNITTTTFDYRIQEQEANDQRHTPEEAGYIAWEPSAGSMDGLVFEIGRTANSVTHHFQALPFYEPFSSPPVFLAGMQTFDGPDTAAVRWQKKQPDGIEVKVEEEQSGDVEMDHTTEVIGYMAFEARRSALPMEFGEIEVNDRWTTVTLNRLYDEPVVIVGALSYNGPDPSVIRVRNVTGSGFEVRVQEWEYLDGHHAIEQVNYLVIESGSYELPGGSRVEAGRFSANAVGSFAAVPFKQPFSTVPVVMTTTASDNEGDAVAMRLRNITTTTFDYRIQEQEANDQRHTPEEAGYIAWEPSAGSMDGLVFEIDRTANSVTHHFQALPFYEPFSSPPVFLAGMQTFDGPDTAAVRWQKKQPAGIEIKVEEEQSMDAERDHATEVVGYMVLKNQ